MSSQRPSRRSLLRAATGSAAALTLAAATPAAAKSARAQEVSSTLVDPATPAGARPAVSTSHQTLVFSDEFLGGTLNPDRWNARDWQRSDGNHGVDYWYKPANVHVANGRLALGISRLATESYAGSRVDTQGKFDFTFGTIEYSAALPPTIGHLGALWLQATNSTLPGGVADGTARDGEEIDIIESYSVSDTYAITVHWDGYAAAHQSSGMPVNAPGLHDAGRFHTFTTEWTSAHINFYYDTTLVRSITDPKLVSQVQEFAIASNEIITFAEGDIHNAPLDATSDMYVDYVRIWQ
ncbi:glycoside hydrolase family 16 protein [Streptomyces sp. NPDC004752]